DEVLRFLIGQGYIEREAREIKPETPEQIEYYPLFINRSGEFALGKGPRARGFDNENLFFKEWTGSQIFQPANGVRIISPTQEQAPELYATGFGNQTSVPYLSFLSLNSERAYNDDPEANLPGLIDDP